MSPAKKRVVAQASVIAIAVAFILIGIFRDEVKTVLQKAVNICYECIGLG